MNKINPNFGYWLSGTYHYKFSITNNVLTAIDNPYVKVSLDDGYLSIYALKDIAIAFSQNCFNSNFTPSTLTLQYNPTYVSLSDNSYSVSGDACDLTLFRCLEKGYGIELLDFSSTGTYNIELLIR